MGFEQTEEGEFEEGRGAEEVEIEFFFGEFERKYFANFGLKFFHGGPLSKDVGTIVGVIIPGNALWGCTLT